jgi:hypothetical protein
VSAQAPAAEPAKPAPGKALDPALLGGLQQKLAEQLIVQSVGRCMPCEALPPPGQGLSVKIALRLKADGTLDGPPTVVAAKPEPAFAAQAQTALAALAKCQPYGKGMPKLTKTGPAEIVVTINPDRMALTKCRNYQLKDGKPTAVPR